MARRFLKVPVIVCIGWGSLVWEPARAPGLPLASEGVHAGVSGDGGTWRSNGPRLPIEFARHSGRAKRSLAEQYVSLVIVEGAGVPDVTTLWAPLVVPTGAGVDYAAEKLAEREGVPDTDRSIGRYPARRGSRHPGSAAIEEWAIANKIDGAVWTSLGRNWDGTDGRMPSEAEVLVFLRGQLTREAHAGSERYIRNAPRQIVTPFRSVIERELGWMPV